MNTESQVLNVPIEDIIPNRFQPRLTFDEKGLQELASSIKEHGIIQPLVLRRLGDKYEIVAGERRYKASKIAGLTSIPAIISNLDDKSSAEIAIVENIQRKDLTSIEEAKSYKSLLDKGYLTQDELAQKMGLSQSAISNKLRLLTLSNNVQDALMQGKISERHARSLLQIANYEEQDKWLKRIIDERLTVKDLDRLIKSSFNEENNDTGEQTTLVANNNIESNSDNNMNLFDINTPANDNSNLIDNSPILQENSSRPIPNKFFNFLEDEEANMSTKEEEIELLDFIVPQANQIKEKDLTKANNLVDNLIEELKSSTYNVSLEKNEDTNEIIYTIKVNKKEE